MDRLDGALGSEADRLVPVQNSVDLYDAIASGIDTELDTDACNSGDMLLIANIIKETTPSVNYL